MLVMIIRMHSSRMRTGHSLNVCQSLLLGGEVSAAGGGVCSGGCLLSGCVCSQGVSASGGMSALGGCLLLGDVCSGGCLLGGGCLLWGVSAPRGVSALVGGVCSWGMWVSQDALRQTPPPVNRITDACKNITLAQLRCGR